MGDNIIVISGDEFSYEEVYWSLSSESALPWPGFHMHDDHDEANMSFYTSYLPLYFRMLFYKESATFMGIPSKYDICQKFTQPEFQPKNFTR